MMKKIFYFSKNNYFLIIVFCCLLLAIITFALTFGQKNDPTIIYIDDKLSGVIDNVVHINDLDADYYYYKGQNYTHSDDGSLPTLESKDIYPDDRLVEVQITYSSIDLNSGLHAYVSLTELQDTYIYYKIYPVHDNGTPEDLTDDYIMIELIENPFTNRPNDKGFNGWVTDYFEAEITLDKDYYIRHAKVPVTYTGGMPDKVEIDFNAIWVDAAISEVSSSVSWTNAFNVLNSDGMQSVPVITGLARLPFDMSGYFKQVLIGFGVSCEGLYDENGNIGGEYQEGCITWEVPVGAEFYDENGILQVAEGDSEEICAGEGTIIFKGAGNYGSIETSGGIFEVLVVGGGGGGGSSGAFGTAGAGGGGAGGLIYIDEYSISSDNINVIVGSGGSGAVYNGTHRFGDDGNNSVFGNLTAIGGGGGAGGNAQGSSGGSGGGSRGTSGGTATQSSTNDGYANSGFGNRGGNHGGSDSGAAATGGGGAGSAGANIAGTSGEDGGAGGDGLEFDISGTARYYAGGGGGGVSAALSGTGGAGGTGGGGNGANYNGGAQAGEVNTGSGGGGGTNAHSGADGGSGIIIIRWDEEMQETGCIDWEIPVGAEFYDEAGVLQVALGDSDEICYEGGTIVFRNTGTYNNIETSGGDFNVLIVGGGGAGGRSGGAGAGGGGGGAGGLILETAYTVSGGTYNFVVGAGGLAHSSSGDNNGGSGGNSAAFGLTAIAGGGGGARSNNGLTGGSGGGGGSRGGTGGAGTTNQGTAGGDGDSPVGGDNAAGGGGGFSETGTNGITNDSGGAGGDGANLSAIFGTSFGDNGWFAGGGGGGISGNNTAGSGGAGGGGLGGVLNNDGEDGMPNTGGGGGGAPRSVRDAGDGGSGVIIISWGEAAQVGCFCADPTGCTYYEMIEDEYYDESEIYYELTGGSMQLVDEEELPFEFENIYAPGFDDDSVMAGYFRPVLIPRFSSIDGFYDEFGYAQSGTCNTIGGCALYELIQYYDEFGNPETPDIDEDYYYLVTRDTNILVMTTTMSSTWGTGDTKPFTLTSVHNGVDYRNAVTWNTNRVVRAYNDTNIENIRMASGQNRNTATPPGNATTARTLYGNWQNVRIGRGITQVTTQTNFHVVLGGNNNAIGSSGNIVKYRLIIESGLYNTFSLANGASSAVNTFIEAKGIYGNDYDRVTANNNNLELNFCASGSWGGNVFASSDISDIFDLVVKSGQFGTSESDFTTGIYIGGRQGGSHNAIRRGRVEGGWIYNLIGGPLTASNRGNINDSYIFVTGGEINTVVGGAGRSATYGHRIIQITGGQVNYSVFGGSNGYSGSGSDGTVIGSSYLYIGGTATIGDPVLVANNSTLWNAEAGSVFGIGNGRSGFSSIGSSSNSNIIINDEVTINRNVYGGGNFSAVGISSGSSTAESNFEIWGGTIMGSIYGGGNNNGSGSASVHAMVNINVHDINLMESLYGGSNNEGTIYGDVNINILDGTFNEDIYGGGRGGYINSSNPGTYIRNNIEVVIGNGTNGPEVLGDLFLGSAYGTVNAITQNPIYTPANLVSLLFNNGTVNGAVYGGAKGSAAFSPVVAGDATVTINGGIIEDLYGANDFSGSILGNSNIYLNGGTITTVYGGGNQVAGNNTNIYLDGSTTTEIYGGSNLSGETNSSNIVLNSGIATTVYGGNNIGGRTNSTNITLNGGTIQNIYGGGNQAEGDTTHIVLMEGSVPNVYGGGAEAEVLISTTIELIEASINNIYGGSNLSGNVAESNIVLGGGDVITVYGGNNIGGITSQTNIIAAGVIGEEMLPETDDLQYVYDLTEPSLPDNATPCEVGGLQFTHVVDKRDGDKIYPVTNIDGQCFMTRNLSYTGNGCLTNSWTTSAPFNACASHSTSWGTEIAYQWAAAMDGSSLEESQGLCPADWHIPSDDEMKDVELYLGMTQAQVDGTGYRGNQGVQLKDNNNWNGTNLVGLSILPTGYRSTAGAVTGVNDFGLWWTSSGSGSSAGARYMHTTNDGINRSDLSQAFGFSIRCKMGEFTGEMPEPIVTDGSTIETIYGGGNQATVNNTNIVLNNGTITNVYGGGAEANVTNTTLINLNDITVTNLYGGSNLSGDVENTMIFLNDGQATNVYGGNNLGGKTVATNINLSGTSVGTLYGGGNQAEVDTTNIALNSGTATNVYGGGAEANVLISTLVNLNDGTFSNIYGGSNLSGLVAETTVNLNGGVASVVYGGNNIGGSVTETNVNLANSLIGTLYGGGNQADVIEANVLINATENLNSVYGGGNQASVNLANVIITAGQINEVYGGSNQSGTVQEANININGSAINIGDVYGGNNSGGTTGNAIIVIDSAQIDDIYGGGNEAVTTSSTDVLLVDAIISGSVYAGGNGVAATVLGNTMVSVTGDSVVGVHVFGGGNAANTGSEGFNNSVALVNISGASIGGNVYGGANTAVVYGETDVNIGHSIFAAPFIERDILIEGTVFGGGEANFEGSEEYDYSFISVTQGIEMQIVTDRSYDLTINGSIFGSGNASSTTGISNIYIGGYGSPGDNKRNVSIQRADEVVLDNSFIELFGATDRTNEYSTVLFSISRVDELKLKNESAIFLETGTNLLKKLSSWVDINEVETKASVVIDEYGNVTRNVDNRVYMLEGRNLNIATNEAVTSYGDVSGMMFLGMYTRDFAENVHTAFYSHEYEQGDPVLPGEFYHFSSGSYVLGRHMANHDITIDGFYTHEDNEDDPGTINTVYIVPTPEASTYYMWSVGESVFSYDIDLIASKYSTLGAVELPLINYSEPNTIFSIIGVNFSGLAPDIELVKQNEIPRISQTGEADTKMSLVMKTSNTGWITVGETNFLSEAPNPIYGTFDYVSENSTLVPSLLFYLYHSKNLETSGDMGIVTISLFAITPIDDLNNEVERIDINVDMSRVLYTTDFYDAAMTPGAEHNMFVATKTDITTKSRLSAYFSLYAESEDPFYNVGDHRALVSSFALPENTTITMIDLVPATPEYYYYVVSAQDVIDANAEIAVHGEASYQLARFVKMGSTSSGNSYDDESKNDDYYDDNLELTSEEFVFIVDFGQTDINVHHQNEYLLMELRNVGDQTLLTVLGIQHASMTYNLFFDYDSVIELNATINKPTIYIGDEALLDITTDFVKQMYGGLIVEDTTFHDKKLGLKITIHDENDNQLNGFDLMGVDFIFSGVTYYPRMDGSVRINVAPRVANVFSRIRISTINSNLSTGEYRIRVESFGSADGIYYGLIPSDEIWVDINVYNEAYGLNVAMLDGAKIIDKATGHTLYDNNVIVFNVDFVSGLNNPNIRMAWHRRNYDNIYSLDYDLVDLADSITNPFSKVGDDSLNEYMIINPVFANNALFVYLRENLVSGTYKIKFLLYDGDIYIGEVYRYVIIK